MELKGKTAIVTGGGHRVGRALVLALAEAGCNILLHYNHSAAEAECTAEEARRHGVRVVVHQADLARLEEVMALPALAVEQLDPAQILVNCAAIFPKDTLTDLTLSAWTETLQTNLQAPVFLTQAFVRALPEQAEAAVVNITDWRTERPYRTHLSYTVAKGALDTFTATAALILAPRVRVNGIALGAMLPPPDRDQAYLDALVATIPLQRAGGTQVIADTLLYLLRNDFVTGEIIRLSGGAHLK